MTDIDNIAKLMLEMDATGMMNTDAYMPTISSDENMMNSENSDFDDFESDFTEEEMTLAKDFITKIGSIEKAMDLLEKTEECGECLGFDDNDEQMIQIVASKTPDSVDMPTNFMM